jgi:hypothetical protein
VKAVVLLLLFSRAYLRTFDLVMVVMMVVSDKREVADHGLHGPSSSGASLRACVRCCEFRHTYPTFTDCTEERSQVGTLPANTTTQIQISLGRRMHRIVGERVDVNEFVRDRLQLELFRYPKSQVNEAVGPYWARYRAL